MFSRRPLSAAVLVVLVLSALPTAAGKLPAGTELTVRLETEVVPESRRPEPFSALLSYPVFLNGREVLPAGSRVEGEARGNKNRVQLSPRFLILPDGQRLDFNAAVRDIDRKRLRTEEKEGTIEPSGSKADAARQAAQVGLSGAAVGAMATGSGKGAGIGAAAGVAAVLIGRKVASRGNRAVIPAGTQVTLSLARPLEIPDQPMTTLPSTKPAADPDERRPVLRRRD